MYSLNAFEKRGLSKVDPAPLSSTEAPLAAGADCVAAVGVATAAPAAEAAALVGAAVRHFLITREDLGYTREQIDALIANEYGIFGMFEFREVHEFEKFWAIGSGKAYALGAMYAVYETLADPVEIATVGVLASCEFDTSCDLPVSIHALSLNKEGLA